MDRKKNPNRKLEFCFFIFVQIIRRKHNKNVDLTTVCFYNIAYGFKRKFKLCSWLNVARNRHAI